MGAHGTNKQQVMFSTHRDIWWPAWAHQQDRDSNSVTISIVADVNSRFLLILIDHRN